MEKDNLIIESVSNGPLFGQTFNVEMLNSLPSIKRKFILSRIPGLKKENKVIAHIAVLLTLICIVGLFMPLNGAMGRGDNVGVLRVVAMITSGLIAMIFFVKSFIANRKKS